MDTLSLLCEGKLAGSKRLDLSCGLTHFPTEIYDLADTLEILNLSGNALSSLPDDLNRLHKLRVIFCSDNQFDSVPEVLGSCMQLEMVGFKANRINHLPAAALPERLRWLILTDNRLEVLPAEIGRCTRIQKLMLAGNLLHDLPDEMAALRQLELLRISANRFASLPPWLLTLPRLAWLAIAGNPFSEQAEVFALANQDISDVSWSGIELQHRLGEGASGVIHRASYIRDGSADIVAVKLYKGEVTSDGLPQSEMAACIAAGSHPNLIGVAGRISGHPDGMAGLVMPLIGASFTNLAGPPSLESCTRDVYPEGVKFSLRTVLSMAQGIAAAAEHLHGRGILHGDLYAHNMLLNPDGYCLLGDFGAACLLPREDEWLVQSLQRIEVRAFACLLEELIERSTADGSAALRELHQRCAQDDIEARPLFSEIRHMLADLS